MLPGIKLFDLSDKVAIITGGSKGLGEAMAEALASAGAKVVVSSRNLEESEAVASRIKKDYGTDTLAFQADVTSEEQVQALVDFLLVLQDHFALLVLDATLCYHGTS